MVMLYLAHRQQGLSHDVQEYYLSNNLEQADVLGLKGRIWECRDLCTLKLDGIQQFYGKQPPAKKGPAAVPSKPARQPVKGL